MTTQQTSLALLVTFLACSAYAKIIADEGGPPQVWMGPPPHKLFNAGQVDPIRLPCQATGHPQPRIEWYYNGERILDLTSRPRRLDMDGSTLLVEGEKLQGVYQCKAFNKYGVGLSNTSFLEEAYTIYKPRSFTGDVVKKEVTEGHDITISCEHVIDSRPKAVIEWRKVTDYNHRGYQVKETNIISQDDEGNLVISRVDRSLNDAMFKCYAANPVKLGARGGRKNRIIVLSDEYHFNKTRVPNFIYSTQSPHLVLEGDQNVELKCAFGGWPEPTVRWSKENGQALPPHARVGQFSHTLTFDEVTREDEGNYDCWADNGAKSNVYHVNLKVEARPVIATPLQGRSVPAGSDVIFTCLADGKPIPQIQWYIDDKTISESTKSFSWSVSEDGADLSLFGISLNDTSAVHCNASNVHGYVLASTALRVYPMPTTTTTTTTTQQPTTTEQPISTLETDHMTTHVTDTTSILTMTNSSSSETDYIAYNATYGFTPLNSSASESSFTDDVTVVSTATTKMADNGTNLAWTDATAAFERASASENASESAQNFSSAAQNLHHNFATSEPNNRTEYVSESFTESIPSTPPTQSQTHVSTHDFALTNNTTSDLFLFNVLSNDLTSVNNFTFSDTTAETRTPSHEQPTLPDIPHVKSTPKVVTTTKAPSTTTKKTKPVSTVPSNVLHNLPELVTYKPKDPADHGNAIGHWEKEKGSEVASNERNTDQMIILAAVVSIAVIILFGLLIFLILLFRRRRRNYNVTDREYELGYIPGSPEAKPIYSVPEAAPITPPGEASEDQNFIVESTNV